MNNKKLALPKGIAIPVAVGAASMYLTRGAMEDFKYLNQPLFSPPGWIFPIAWTILYILMGTASWFITIAKEQTEKVIMSLELYRVQLAVNFFWPIFFFDFGWYFFSSLWLIFLCLLIAVLIYLFWQIDKRAGYFMLPCLIWAAYAAYLNISIYFLN